MEALALLLILLISVVLSLLCVYIRWIAVRWFLAASVPFLLADLYYWSPVIFEGRDSSEYGSWVLVFLFIWYLPSYLASIAILFLMRNRQNLAFKRRAPEPIEQVASRTTNGNLAPEPSNSRVFLGFVLSAVAAGLLQGLGSADADFVSATIIALVLALLFGFPLYKLHKMMGWIKFSNVVAGGGALGVLLAIMYLGLIGPELWSAWGVADRPHHYLTAAMIVITIVVASAMFWVVSVSPLKKWVHRTEKA